MRERRRFSACGHSSTPRGAGSSSGPRSIVMAFPLLSRRSCLLPPNDNLIHQDKALLAVAGGRTPPVVIHGHPTVATLKLRVGLLRLGRRHGSSTVTRPWPH